ncbi:MAG: hypothetical protein HGN29_14750 [Asgard group archaeon]|nr:hypothetical protein [Asgard group archaeon]
MPYCSKCGVEVDQGVEKCPLCQLQINGMEEDASPPQKYPDVPVESPKKASMTPEQKRIRAWEIVGATLLIPFLIIVFTDLIANETVSWARFPMIALLLAWLLATFPLLFAKRPLVIIAGEVLSVLIFLVLVDYLHDWVIDWFYKLALPNLAVLILIASAVTILSTQVKRKGANIAAFILFGIGALNLGLDLIIMSTLAGKITMKWSLFVLVPCFIIGGFLLYLHYRFKNLNQDIKERLQM